ncbi:hypothetical protein [Mucilaginibacter puniceus]
MSAEELMNIIDNKFDYTDLAVTVAIEELAKRKPTEEDIKNYKDNIIATVDTFISKNIEVDLNNFQKLLFYIIWIPIITYPFKANYSDDGYELKLRQSNYYSLAGFIFFMVAGILSVPLDASNLLSFIMWFAGFIPAYLFDEYFNRQRQITKLRRLFNVDDANEDEQNMN